MPSKAQTSVDEQQRYWELSQKFSEARKKLRIKPITDDDSEPPNEDAEQTETPDSSE